MALDNGQYRRPAAPGARKATKPGDGRLRRNKDRPRQTTAGRAKELAKIEAWALGWPVAAGEAVVAYQKTQQSLVVAPVAPPQQAEEVRYVEKTDGSGLVAQVKDTSRTDEYLEEEGLNPVVGLMLG